MEIALIVTFGLNCAVCWALNMCSTCFVGLLICEAYVLVGQKSGLGAQQAHALHVFRAQQKKFQHIFRAQTNNIFCAQSGDLGHFIKNTAFNVKILCLKYSIDNFHPYFRIKIYHVTAKLQKYGDPLVFIVFSSFLFFFFSLYFFVLKDFPVLSWLTVFFFFFFFFFLVFSVSFCFSWYWGYHFNILIGCVVSRKQDLFSFLSYFLVKNPTYGRHQLS